MGSVGNVTATARNRCTAISQYVDMYMYMYVEEQDGGARSHLAADLGGGSKEWWTMMVLVIDKKLG